MDKTNFEAGQIVGLYEVIEPYSVPSLGQAYRVRTIGSGDERLMFIQGREEGEAAQRFFREVAILSSLAHPNVLRIHDSGYSYGLAYFTTELPSGSTLERVLHEGLPGLREGLRYVCDLLSGLECVHQAKVVHRSIAPDRVYILDDGSAKLTGFSLARRDLDPSLTLKGSIIGTEGYLPPEQAEGSSKVDARSDLYSTAALLYHVVTGRRPFDSKTLFQLMQQRLSRIIPPPAELRPEIPQALNLIILKGLATEPSGRFQSAGEFRDALEQVRLELP